MNIYFRSFQLSAANDEVPTKLTSTINKAELNTKQIENLKIKSDDFKKRAEDFLNRTQPLLSELDKRFMAISKLEKVLEYFKSYAKIQDLRYLQFYNYFRMSYNN